MENLENINILVVDDNERNLGVVGNLLIEKGYNVSLITSGQEAFGSIEKLRPDLILLDIMMPEMDGFEVCAKLKEDEKTSQIPIIFLTAKTETEDIVKGFQIGGVDYILKPFKKEELLARVDIHIRLKQTEKSLKEALIVKENLLRSEQSLLNDTLKGSIKVLIEIISLISPQLFNHSIRMRKITRKVAERLGIEKVWEVEISLLLSHIGCVTVPTEILSKKIKGENLSEVENNIFFSHPGIGKKLISNIPRMEKIADSIAYQLKWYDGSGIPNDNLKQNEIPIIARILKVISDFEMLLNQGKTYSQSIDIMRSNSNQYDPHVLDALESEILNIPEGYLVKSIPLNNLLTGMVLADDIIDFRDIVLISKGKEITESLKILLSNYASSGSIIEPIKVLVPAQAE